MLACIRDSRRLQLDERVAMAHARTFLHPFGLEDRERIEVVLTPLGKQQFG